MRLIPQNATSIALDGVGFHPDIKLGVDVSDAPSEIVDTVVAGSYANDRGSQLRVGLRCRPVNGKSDIWLELGAWSDWCDQADTAVVYGDILAGKSAHIRFDRVVADAGRSWSLPGTAFAQHDLIWWSNRRTPSVVPKGKPAAEVRKPSYGKVTKRRKATAAEEKQIANGQWVRVNENGDRPGDPNYKKKKSAIRPQHNAASNAVQFANPWRDEMGRFAEKGYGYAATFDEITADERRGDSRPVSAAEFQRLARLGQEQLDRFTENSAPIDGLDENWDAIKSQAFDEAQESWGGSTIDARTGEFLPDGANKYALTVKDNGISTVFISENASRSEFDAAMNEAKERFRPILERQNHYLGVFHDDDLNRIDIDPVTVVDTVEEVHTIGAATRAIGGAYNFADGNGYWPPHVDPSLPNEVDLPPLTAAAGDGDDRHFKGPGEWRRKAKQAEGAPDAPPDVPSEEENDAALTIAQFANPWRDSLGRFAERGYRVVGTDSSVTVGDGNTLTLSDPKGLLSDEVRAEVLNSVADGYDRVPASEGPPKIAVVDTAEMKSLTGHGRTAFALVDDVIHVNGEDQRLSGPAHGQAPAVMHVGLDMSFAEYHALGAYSQAVLNQRMGAGLTVRPKVLKDRRDLARMSSELPAGRTSTQRPLSNSVSIVANASQRSGWSEMFVEYVGTRGKTINEYAQDWGSRWGWDSSVTDVPIPAEVSAPSRDGVLVASAASLNDEFGSSAVALTDDGWVQTPVSGEETDLSSSLNHATQEQFANPWRDERGRFAPKGYNAGSGAEGGSNAGGSTVESDSGSNPWRDKKIVVTPEWDENGDIVVDPKAKVLAKHLREEAEQKEPEITARLAKLAGDDNPASYDPPPDGELYGYEFRLKAEDKIAEKVMRELVEKPELEGDIVAAAGVIKDTVRYTVHYTDDTFGPSAQLVVDGLRAEGNTVKVKNTWPPELGSAYKGINAQVRQPDGFRYEVQFHTPNSQAVKDRMHAIYQRQRTSPPGSDAYKQAEAEMIELSKTLPMPTGAAEVYGVER